MPLRIYKGGTTGTMPRLRESSAMQGPRESGDIMKIWIKVSAMSSQLESVTNVIRRMQEELNRLRLRKGGVESTSDCPYG